MEEQTRYSAVNWPLPQDIGSALGADADVQMRGWVSELSPLIGNPVIFLRPEGETGSFVPIEETRDYNSTACQLCVAIRSSSESNLARETFCNRFDNCAATKLFSLEDSAWIEPPSLRDWEEHEHSALPGGKWYSYSCPLIGFTEWIIPVRVKGKIAGAFISGQFRGGKHSPFSGEQILKNYAEGFPQGNLSFTAEEIDMMTRNATAEPDHHGEKVDGFFTHIAEIQQAIDTAYDKEALYSAREVQRKMLQLVWDEEGHYPEALNLGTDTLLTIKSRFRALRSNLFDSLIYLREKLDLVGVTVFKPRSAPEDIEHRVQIDGAVLDNEHVKVIGDHLTFDRDFPSADIHLNTSAIEQQMRKEQCSNRLTSIVAEEEACRALLKDGKGHNLTSTLLCVFAPKGYEVYPVAFLLRFKERFHDDFPRWTTKRAMLLETLTQVSTAFLTQWNMIYAEHHRLSLELMNRYLAHEIGQATAGMRLRLDRLERGLRSITGVDVFTGRIGGHKLPQMFLSLLDYAVNFAKDQDAYMSLLCSITGNAFIYERDIDLNYSTFLPFERILNRLIRVFKEDASSDGKSIIAPTGISIHDQMRPKMRGDAAKLEQVLSNLMKNAVKYSHVYTKIHFDAKVTEDRRRYEFTITDYGFPIEEKELKAIFELGYRSEGAIKTDAAGIGFGLYVAQQIVHKHGGEITYKSEPISPMNVSLLRAYAESPRLDINTEMTQKCLEEVVRLKETGEYHQIVSRELPDSPFSPVYYMRHINEPTAKVTATFWIPM